MARRISKVDRAKKPVDHAANERTVPSNVELATPPSSAPPAVVMVVMTDDAVPAMCGNGVMAAVLARGPRPWATGMSKARVMAKIQKLGLPPLVNDTSTKAMAATDPK